jgi:hypothetical protein
MPTIPQAKETCGESQICDRPVSPHLSFCMRCLVIGDSAQTHRAELRHGIQHDWYFGHKLVFNLIPNGPWHEGPAEPVAGVPSIAQRNGQGRIFGRTARADSRRAGFGADVRAAGYRLYFRIVTVITNAVFPSQMSRIIRV